MLKYRDNDRGIALLTVMVIMTVLVIIGSLLLKMVSWESRDLYNYGNSSRGYYVAEAGVDLAIRKWKDYIDTLTLVDGDGQPITNAKADIGTFLGTYLDPTIQVRDLEEKIRDGYSLGSGSSMVSISYISSQTTGELDKILPTTPDPKPLFTLTFTGTYDENAFEQSVQLWYYWNKDTGSYKGYGTPTIADALPIPPPGGGGGGPPEYHPPTTVGGWTEPADPVSSQWTFDEATGTITRGAESPSHRLIITTSPVNAPYSLDMYVHFVLSGTSSQWPGSYVAINQGDLFTTVNISLTVINQSGSPKIQVGILDLSNFVYTTRGPFTRTLDSNSKYRIKTVIENGTIKIDITDNVGQSFNYTANTPMTYSWLALYDGTGPQVDAVFTFPP